MTTAVISQRVLPQTRVVSVLLVVAAAGLTALAAQWRIQLPFTPVPITGQTFAVLLTGAALGWKLGAAGQMFYSAGWQSDDKTGPSPPCSRRFFSDQL